MDTPACAVARIGQDGPWLGFAPAMDDRYEMVVGGLTTGSRRAEADADLLLAMAVAYFEDALEAPPDDLAATHGDIAALVRHVAEAAIDAGRRRLLDEAVDAIDDGLAAEVVIGRLTAALGSEPGVDPVRRLLDRARVVAGDD